MLCLYKAEYAKQEGRDKVVLVTMSAISEVMLVINTVYCSCSFVDFSGSCDVVGSLHLLELT